MPYEFSGQAGGTVQVSHPAGCSGIFGPFGVATFSSTSVGSSTGCADGTVTVSEPPVGMSGYSTIGGSCFAEYPGVPYSRAATYPLNAEVFESVSWNPFGGPKRIVCRVTATFTITATAICTEPVALVATLLPEYPPGPCGTPSQAAAQTLRDKGWEVQEMSFSSDSALCAALADPCVRGLVLSGHGFPQDCEHQKLRVGGTNGDNDPSHMFTPEELGSCRGAGQTLEFVQVIGCYVDPEAWRTAASAVTGCGPNTIFPDLRWPLRAHTPHCGWVMSDPLENITNCTSVMISGYAYQCLPGPCYGVCNDKSQVRPNDLTTERTASSLPPCLSFAVCDTNGVCGDDAYPPTACANLEAVGGASPLTLVDPGGSYNCTMYWPRASGDSVHVVASTFARVPGTAASDSLLPLGKVLWVAGISDGQQSLDSIKVTLRYDDHTLAPGAESELRVGASIQGASTAVLIPAVQDTIANTFACVLPNWALVGVVAPNSGQQPPATGACCALDGSCTWTIETACASPRTWHGVGSSCAPSPCPLVDQFARSDVDASGEVNISDPIYNLAFQFAGGPPPPCLDAADDDDSGEVNISDSIYSLAYQFAEGPPPPPPFPGCGLDPTPDAIGCDQVPPCNGKAQTASPATQVLDGSKRLLLEAVPGTSPDSLILRVTVVTDVPLAGLEGTVRFDPSQLRFARLEKGDRGPRMDFLSARDFADPPRVCLGGVPDFGLAEALAPGTHEIGRLIFARLAAPTPADGAVWLTGGRFVGRDLRAYDIEGAPSVDSASPGVSDEPAGGSVVVFPNPYHPNRPISLQFEPTAQAGDVAVYDVQGRRIKTLYAGPRTATALSLGWDGRSDGGVEVAAGLYYLRVRAGLHQEARSLLLMR